jgi:hypothetical protein
MHCNPLEHVVWDTGCISVLHRPRLDVAQLAHCHLPCKPAWQPTDLLGLVELVEEVPDVCIACPDPGHQCGAMGPCHEQGHVFQCRCAGIVLDKRLKVHMPASWQQLFFFFFQSKFIVLRVGLCYMFHWMWGMYYVITHRLPLLP